MSTEPAATTQRLEHFPVSFFASVMGTAGLTLAWKKAHQVLDLPIVIGSTLQWLTLALFAIIATVYGVKLIRHMAAVKHEFAHPVRLNFFPASSISLLLLAVVFSETHPAFGQALWFIGAPLHLAFTLTVMSSWIHHARYDIKHANPAWFIPVVGNVIVPVGGVAFAPIEISWFFFSIGLVFWIVLMTIVMYRLFFHEPLPERLTPTLFILIAPPAVGFIAWVKLQGGEIDAFARILYHTALFLTLLLASNGLRFFRVRFFLSAWAYSFPVAAMTIATLIMAEKLGGFFVPLAGVLLAALSILIAFLMGRTLLGVTRGEICQPE